MVKKYVVTLTEEERRSRERRVSSGQAAARKLTPARVGLKSAGGPGGPGGDEGEVCEALDVSRCPVERVRQRLVEGGLAAALVRAKPQREYPRKLDGAAEAHLIAVACSHLPEGRSRWTLRRRAERRVALEYVDRVAHECVRQTLKKTNSSRG